MPADLKEPFDPREVILRICDGRSAENGQIFDEFKPLYGSSLVTGWARLHGHPIGILANAQGVLFSEEAQKATQFIQLANQVDVPLLFLHNTTGYMVGAEYEQGGIIKHGAQMLNAVSNSSVPHLSVVMGASYGAGNYGMAGRAFDPRFLFTWPSAKSAVMGPAQLAGVLSIVARAAAEAKGQAYDEDGDAGMRAFVEESVEEQSLPYVLSGMLYDDGVIDPRDTRTVLGICLSVIATRVGGGELLATGCSGRDLDKLDHLAQVARGQPRRDRVAGVPHLPAARDRDRRRALRRRRGPALRRRGRPRRALAWGSAPADTYLRADLLVAAAVSAGADAVHPGYGFLSENADFARAVVDAGLVWVGPTPESIEQMGSKVEAKRIMAAAGVPVLTSPPDPTDADLPLIVKASAGGGGRGMRMVRSLDELPGAVEAAEAEALSAFGDGTVFVEPYVEHSRHVEVQVWGDHHGNNVSVLGARDCSLQRRHQKVVEESPPPGLTREHLDALYAAARAGAAAISYVGAGTMEFLVDAADPSRFWFLEMNTRLQVEHAVTEMLLGVDLVELQLAAVEDRTPPWSRRLRSNRREPVRARGRGAALRRGPVRRLPPAVRGAHPLRDPRGRRDPGRLGLRHRLGRVVALRRHAGQGDLPCAVARGRDPAARRHVVTRADPWSRHQPRSAPGGPSVTAVPRGGREHGVPRPRRPAVCR